MKREIKFENLKIDVSEESGNIRVSSGNDNVLLIGQKMEVVVELIELNCEFVATHYKILLSKLEQDVDSDDINIVSVSIVLRYLYMYNLWRTMYKKQEKRSLRFDEKDFEDSTTHDILISYFKEKYPFTWQGICCALFNMDIDRCAAYIENREAYYNK